MFNGVSFYDIPDSNKKLKVCQICKTPFIPKSGIHKFCSEKCKGKWKYISGTVSTKTQYKKINGNWHRYASRLIYTGGRKRDGLTVETILDKLEEQNYKCALSGVPLECHLEVGVKNQRNASIDRITPGGPYTKENIQMVCRALNSWRADQTVSEFIKWCRAVVDHADQERLEVLGGQKLP